MTRKTVCAARTWGACVALLAWLAIPAVAQSPPQPPQRQEAQRPAGERAEALPRNAPQAEMAPSEQPPPEPPPAQGAGGQEGRPRERPAPPREVPTLRLEATVFRVELPSERIIELDAKKLAADGGTPLKMAKLLEEFGPTQVLHRVDQVPAAGGSREGPTWSQDAPYVSGRQTNKAGTESAAIQRTKVGVRFDFYANYPDETERTRVYATVRVEVSGMSESLIDIDDGIQSPVFWNAHQSYAGVTELARPIVLLTADGTTSAHNGADGAAIVTLLTLSDGTK